MFSILPPWAYYIIAVFLGTFIGSFLNVCIIRIPRQESIVWPGSHCRLCNHKLAFWENIPILSYIFLKGKCRDCKGSISFRYPIVELVTLFLSVLCWWYLHDIKLYLVYFILFICPLIVISFIDLELRIIPNEISLPGIVVGLVVNLIFVGKYGYKHAALDSFLGIIVGGGLLFLVAIIYEKIKKIEGLGGGDVKLAAMLGAFFGWKASIFILLISSLLGSVVGVILIVILKKDSKYAIPFGPFLSLAGIIYFFYGMELVNWYLGLF